MICVISEAGTSGSDIPEGNLQPVEDVAPSSPQVEASDDDIPVRPTPLAAPLATPLAAPSLPLRAVHLTEGISSATTGHNVSHYHIRVF